MLESIKARLADWWQAIIEWDPHWLMQILAGAVLVWILSISARWIGMKVIGPAKRDRAERQKTVRWIGLMVRSLEHGGISAIAGIIRSTTASLMLLMFAMTTVLLMAIDYNGLATIAKIIGWAFFIATFIQATFHIREAATIYEGIVIVEDRQLDEMMADDKKAEELLNQ